MIGDVRLVEEVEGVAGDIYVLDAAVLGPSLLAKLSPTVIKKFMICVQVYNYKRFFNLSLINELFPRFIKKAVQIVFFF